MASYHFAMKTSKNCSAGAKMHCDYICREGKYSSGEKAEELIHKEHGNLPEWAQENPADFWNAADIYEGANRTTYREIELALPNELSREEQKKLVNDFVEEHLGKDFVYSYAMHSNDARLARNVEVAFDEKGEIDRHKTPTIPVKNPHAHIMFCERKLDGIERDKKQFFMKANTKKPEVGGTKKHEKWNGKNRSEHLRNLRESWAKKQNEALEKAGYKNSKVDHRTLEEQKKEALIKGDIEKAKLLDREPEKHLGPRLTSFPKTIHVQSRNHEKIHYVIASREFKALVSQIEECKQRIEAAKLKQSEIPNTKQEQEEKRHDINVSVKEIRQICDTRIEEINKEAELNRQQYKDALKQVISPERAELIAISLLTKGESKALNNEGRKLQDELAKFEEQRKSFLEKPKPSFYQVSYKEEYQKETDALVKWQRELTDRKQSHEQRTAALCQRLERPEVKEQVAKIRENVLKKNAPRKLNAERIRIRSEALKEEKKQVVELKGSVSYAQAPQQVKVVPPASGNSITAASLVTQANRIVNQLDNKERSVGLSAKINTEDGERKVKHGL